MADPSHRSTSTATAESRAFLRTLEAGLDEVDSPAAQRAMLRAIRGGDLSALHALPPRDKRALLELLDARLGAVDGRPAPRTIVDLAEALSPIGIPEPEAGLVSVRPGR